MRTGRQKGGYGFLLLLISGLAQAACPEGDAEWARMPAEALPAFVNARFAAGDYACGIRATSVKATQLGASNDPAAFHERFILRRLALSTSADSSVPVAQRLALLQAAAATTQPASPSRSSPDERKYDTMLALKAAANFRRHGEVASQLDALILALQLDRLQPQPLRLGGAYDASLLVPERPARHLEQLTTIAELSRGDSTAMPLRGQIARNLYYSFSARSSLGEFTATPASCAAIVRLAKALDDGETARRDLAVSWRWRPTMEAARCYETTMRPTESRALVQEAVRITRQEPNVDVRLSRQSSLLQELLSMQHDRAELLSFANEVLATAKVTDTAMGREVRVTASKVVDRLSYP